MDFEHSARTKMYVEHLTDFMQKHVYPNEATFQQQLASGRTRWQVPPILEELKQQARERGLWNLFRPESEHGAGLTNLEYAPCARSWAGPPSRPRSSTAPRPTPGTWRCWSATALRSRRSSG